MVGTRKADQIHIPKVRLDIRGIRGFAYYGTMNCSTNSIMKLNVKSCKIKESIINQSASGPKVTAAILES